MTATAAIVGVGVDLIHVPRIRTLLLRHAGRIKTRREDATQADAEARAAAAHAFARKILHRQEYGRWSALNTVNSADATTAAEASDEQVQNLAKVWSAKEAAFKAISSLPHPRLLTWHDAILAYAPGSRRPVLQYTPELLQCWRQAGLQQDAPPKLHLSISHDGDYVTSFVIAESEP